MKRHFLGATYELTQSNVNLLIAQLEAKTLELNNALNCLREIANEDYRGNRSSASTKAYFFLKATEKEKAHET